jgi:RHS repeat-associated protein
MGTRVVVNDQGSVLETYDYYPFGVQMPGRSWGESLTLEKFTGHERDGEVLRLDYMIARMYDPALGRFLSPDPLADQYPGISPYVYALNNPLIFIDPDGREVQICTGDGDDRDCFTYEAGMSSDGFDANVGGLINTLNQIYRTEIGSEVLSELINTENVYSISITQELRPPGFSPETGTITMDSWVAGSAEITAHELFHAYQHEMGSLESSHFKETEALLFGAGVAENLGEERIPFGRSPDNYFDETMTTLLDSQSFDQIRFYAAVALFKEGSLANITGTYNDRPVRHHKNKQLIHRFFPLVRR